MLTLPGQGVRTTNTRVAGPDDQNVEVPGITCKKLGNAAIERQRSRAGL